MFLTTCPVLPTYVKDFVGMIYSDSGRFSSLGGFDKLPFYRRFIVNSHGLYNVELAINDTLLPDNSLFVEEKYTFSHCSFTFVYIVDKESFLNAKSI